MKKKLDRFKRTMTGMLLHKHIWRVCVYVCEHEIVRIQNNDNENKNAQNQIISTFLARSWPSIKIAVKIEFSIRIINIVRIVSARYTICTSNIVVGIFEETNFNYVKPSSRAKLSEKFMKNRKHFKLSYISI